MNEDFLNGLTPAIRELAGAFRSKGELVGEDVTTLVVRLDAPSGAAAIAAHDPGASYDLFIQMVEVDLRLWNYAAIFLVVLEGPLHGLDMMTRAAEAIADHHGTTLSLLNGDGDSLQCDLDDQQDDGIDRFTRVGRMVVGLRIVDRIQLCGRCGGAGVEKASDGACKLCHGDGRRLQPMAAE